MAKEEEQGAPAVEFSGLIFGFSSAALSYMGLGEEGDGGPAPNRVLARQNIDIIRLLKEKTAGNLTEDENKLMEQILTDLMKKFVEVFSTGT